MDTQREFARRLILVREKNEETQQQLADAVGVTRQTLSRYELGERTAGIDILAAIAQHYGVSADYLLGLSDTQTTQEDMKVACIVTGLNDLAIEAVKRIIDAEEHVEYYKYKNARANQWITFSTSDVVNSFLCSVSFEKIIGTLNDVFTDTITRCFMEDEHGELLDCYSSSNMDSEGNLKIDFKIPTMNGEDSERADELANKIKELDYNFRLQKCIVSLDISDFVDEIVDDAEHAYVRRRKVGMTEHTPTKPQDK